MSVQVNPIGRDEILYEMRRLIGAAIREHGETETLEELSLYLDALEVAVADRDEGLPTV